MGRQVRIKRKIETFPRGYRLQFTEEVFTIATVQTQKPPTYTRKDANNSADSGQILRGRIYSLRKILSNLF